MLLEHIDIIDAPADKVFALVRDKLPDLARHLPSVAKIEKISSEELSPDNQKVISHWYANVELPGLVKKFLSDKLLSWKDTAIWNGKDREVSYELQSFVVNDLFEAKGRNFFVDGGNQTTQLKVTCEINIYPEKIPGIPKLLMKKVKPLIEKVIEKMLQPNLTSLGKGLKSYLDENKI